MLARIRHGLHLRARVNRAVSRLRGATSVSDTPAYTQLCARAATDRDVFATFKRQPAYTAILEHVSCSLGAEYLRVALEQTPEIADRLGSFRRNDEIGTPNVCDYGHQGVYSPTTLRYVKVLSDLQTLFGPLDRLRILEIGVGYGGQCFIVHAGGGFRSYALVDLPPVLALAKRYLDTLGVPNVELGAQGAFDLVVSNYAFSECRRKVQTLYLDELLKPTPRGYMTCNFMEGMGREEIAAQLPGSRWIEENPRSAKRNATLVWGTWTTTDRPAL
jgi:hypothetical protein